MLSELDAVLDNLNQGSSISSSPVVDTTDTSGEDTDSSQLRQRVRWKPSFEIKKRYATHELAWFSVTGPTDAPNKLKDFYRRIYSKDVSVLTHGTSEILRYFHRIRHFARDQRLRLETPGWRVLDFDSNPLTRNELERQLDKIMRAP